VNHDDIFVSVLEAPPQTVPRLPVLEEQIRFVPQHVMLSILVLDSQRRVEMWGEVGPSLDDGVDVIVENVGFVDVTDQRQYRHYCGVEAVSVSHLDVPTGESRLLYRHRHADSSRCGVPARYLHQKQNDRNVDVFQVDPEK
jgi:hypothetical protein